MGVNISTEQLTFIDLTQYDSFTGVENPNAIDEFLALPVGQAQLESLKEEMANQALAQGVEDYEATDSQIRRILFSEQSSQSYGYSSADVTNEQMLDDHGPSWLEELGSLVSNWGNKADEAVKEVAHDGVGLAVDGVTQNDGMTGQASDALQNRQQQLDEQINDQSGGSILKM